MGSLVISNYSGQLIKVKYQFKQYRGESMKSPECHPLERLGAEPAVAPTSAINPWFGLPNWTRLSSESYSFDTFTCRVQVDLAAGMSLRVSHLQHRFTGKEEEDLEELDHWEQLVPEVVIETSKGSIQYKGAELVKHFRRRNAELFEFQFR
jgi:hypothetical protein